MKKIILNAGGTGGHFFPAIAVGKELIKRGYNIRLITDLRCQKYLTSEVVITSYIIDLYLKNTNIIEKCKSFLKVIISSFKALILLSKIRPAVIVSFGGYPTIPSLVAAVILRIPIILHEQNCFIGKTNKFFTKFAKIVALSYHETDLNKKNTQKILVTGDIVRNSIKALKVKNNFDNEIFRIFIFGGSQATKIFSKLIPLSIRELLKSKPDIKLQITQQAALVDQKEIEKIYSELNIGFKLADFFSDIASIYENSELCICRSGASTIAELTTIGLPAIFIPYPYAADNHQYFNTKAIEEREAGWCVEQAKATPELLARKILELSERREILKIASGNLLKRKCDGAKLLADTVEKIIE